MTILFKDMMTGLDEVGAFLAGERTGYSVSAPAEVDVKPMPDKLNKTGQSAPMHSNYPKLLK